MTTKPDVLFTNRWESAVP